MSVVHRQLGGDLKLGALNANRSNQLTAHLVQASEHMLDPCPHPGDSGVAALLTCAERLARLGFALHLHPSARVGQSRIPRSIDVALVCLWFLLLVEISLVGVGVDPTV